MVLPKNYHNSDGSRSYPVVLFSVGSKQKIKMKTQNIMASSYRLKVSTSENKGIPFLSCLTHEI